jgi:protein TonB
MNNYEKLKQRHPLRRNIILVIVLLLLILVAIIFPRFKELKKPTVETDIIYIEPEKTPVHIGPMIDTPGSESLLQFIHERPILPELIPDSMNFEWPALDSFDTFLEVSIEEMRLKPPPPFKGSVHSFEIIDLDNFNLEDIYPPDTVDVWKAFERPPASAPVSPHIDPGTPPVLIGGLKAIYNNLIYPDIDWSSVVEDRVIFQAFIDTNGIATQVLMMKTCGNDTLDKAAQNAIKKTLFKPAIVNGEPVGVWIAIPVSFKLN